LRINSRIDALVPAANLFSGYQKQWLQPDLLAGVTTAAVVIPKAMAYATIAGLPVQVGLYTAFLPMVIYALLERLDLSASARPLPWPS
jgi:MFS superfamily sulfate permease-like transporter